MGSTLSQKNAIFAAVEVDAAIVETQDTQNLKQAVEDDHSDEMDASNRAIHSRKRYRAQGGEAEPTLGEDGVSYEPTQESEKKVESTLRKERVENEKEFTEEIVPEFTETLTKRLRLQTQKKKLTLSEEVQVTGIERQKVTRNEKAKRAWAIAPPPSLCSPSIEIAFPKDEVPIELCPFSSDESVEEKRPSFSFRRNNFDALKTLAPSPSSSTAALESGRTSSNVAAVLVPVTAEGPASIAPRSMGKRKRRKRLSYSAPRNKLATKSKHEETSVSTLFASEKISIEANGYTNFYGVEVDSDRSASASTTAYPDTDASHLYPSTFKGESWQWRDADAYFDPLMQSELDNLVRWRKENADYLAEYSSAWCGMSEIESKRAVSDLILADASKRPKENVDIIVRRGRHYRDAWEEEDFFAQKRRDFMEEGPSDKGQEIAVKSNRKGSIYPSSLSLGSHRDLVYGYDDDLFEDFRLRLEGCVNLFQLSKQNEESGNEYSSDRSANKFNVDESILPSYPLCQFHPASLGLWKLRKNQMPDFKVVHPASLNREHVSTRRKEEMKRHLQLQHEFQVHQANQSADLISKDNEGTGDSTHDWRCGVLNSEVTGNLPSFGNIVEKDEILEVLTASITKLIPLSIQNWQIAQRVYERAACSIQCAPILESEAAAARELENMLLRLSSSADFNANTLSGVGPDSFIGPARPLRTLQSCSSLHDLIAYSVRRDIGDNCSLAVAASVEFASRLRVGDVVDVLDRNACWNYGEVVEIYLEEKQKFAKFLLLRLSLWSEDTVEWIAASEGRILPQGVATGQKIYSVGPTRAHRVRIRYDQCLAKELEQTYPQRQTKQANAASQVLAQWHNNGVVGFSGEQKSRRKRLTKSAASTSTL
ncbi:uncharacterized protein PHALS_09006 [Plasmopara halstedii]|uniref:Uncharacterized protein n=1 Tax=Plasmopara halstedii TaxID=4781 RepID=A0A0P1AD78_PLAHL|nr:uncharacterized protein PHALS_09006 [Plasmopara halstedii]CEG38964.1 hypothetical protein PHALS_09006 [Plasmopara halstedii]|eukprot:XP_024575333.1 hypothetical protein PHALS_09006 [Plasmopara halstedii]